MNRLEQFAIRILQEHEEAISVTRSRDPDDAPGYMLSQLRFHLPSQPEQREEMQGAIDILAKCVGAKKMDGVINIFEESYSTKDGEHNKFATLLADNDINYPGSSAFRTKQL